MTLRTTCQCSVEVSAEDMEVLGDTLITHIRADHPDWPYPDMAIRNYAEATQRLRPLMPRHEAIGDVTTERVTLAQLDDWLGFFDHDVFSDHPEWASCYCTEPHVGVPPPQGNGPETQPWRWYRETMQNLLQDGRAYGYLAYVDGRPAGWVNASLRSEFALYRGLTASPADEEVIAVACFAIAPPYRRHGLATNLLDRVLADAPSRGVPYVEAFPAKEPREGDASHFRGPRSLLLSRGFEPVEERERYTIMRRRSGL